MMEMYKDFCTKFPVISIEDPFEQDDWEPCKALTSENVCQVWGHMMLQALVQLCNSLKWQIGPEACVMLSLPAIVGVVDIHVLTWMSKSMCAVGLFLPHQLASFLRDTVCSLARGP